MLQKISFEFTIQIKGGKFRNYFLKKINDINVSVVPSVHFSFIQQVVQTVNLFLVGQQKTLHEFILGCKHIYILSFENSSVLFPRDSQDWGLLITKMFQHAPLFAFINMQISAVLKKKYIPIPIPFQLHTFQATMGFNNLFTLYRKIITCHTINVSGCHELACIRVS